MRFGRGFGRGAGGRRGGGNSPGNRPGSGPGGECVCPSCGHRQPHQRGVACQAQSCPKCGAQMLKA